MYYYVNMKNIIEFTEKFKTEQDCINYLKKVKGTDCHFPEATERKLL